MLLTVFASSMQAVLIIHINAHMPFLMSQVSCWMDPAILRQRLGQLPIGTSPTRS